VAISRQAREQLEAFAQEAELAARIHDEPWRLARLQASALQARAGETILLNWAAPAVLPVFLRLGADAPWEPVPPEARREVTLAFADLAVSLRVGPHLARRLRVRVIVPKPALEIFPAARFSAPFGGCARLEVYALCARELAVREHPADPWRPLPARCALEFPDHIAPRQLQLRALGWEGSALSRDVHIGVDHAAAGGLFERMLARTASGKLADTAAGYAPV